MKMTKLSRSRKSRSTSFKGFNIPKKSSSNFLAPVESGSLEEKQILQDVYKTCLSSDYVNSWKAQRVMLVHNASLENDFAEKKRELRNEAGGKLLGEGLAFSVESADDVETICRDGPCCKDCRHSLGNPHSGVSVCRHIDVLLRYARGMDYEQPFSIVVYKVVLGRPKAVGPRTSTADLRLDPTPNFDSHTSAIKPSSGDPLNDLLERSMVYMYEYNESALPVSHPRHCIPFAVIAYHSTRKTFPLVENCVASVDKDDESTSTCTDTSSDTEEVAMDNASNTKEEESRDSCTSEEVNTKVALKTKASAKSPEVKEKTVKKNGSLKLRILQLEYLRRNAASLLKKQESSSLGVEDSEDKSMKGKKQLVKSSPAQVREPKKKEQHQKVKSSLKPKDGEQVKILDAHSTKLCARNDSSSHKSDNPMQEDIESSVQVNKKLSNPNSVLKVKRKRKKKGSMTTPGHKRRKTTNRTPENGDPRTMKQSRVECPGTESPVKKSEISCVVNDEQNGPCPDEAQESLHECENLNIVVCSQVGTVEDEDIDYTDFDFDICDETSEDVNYANCDMEISDDDSGLAQQEANSRFIYPNDVDYRVKSSGEVNSKGSNVSAVKEEITTHWNDVDDRVRSSAGKPTRSDGQRKTDPVSSDRARSTLGKHSGIDGQRKTGPVRSDQVRSKPGKRAELDDQRKSEKSVPSTGMNCPEAHERCEATNNPQITYSYIFRGKTFVYALRSEIRKWRKGGKFVNYRSSVEPHKVYYYPEFQPVSRKRKEKPDGMDKDKENCGQLSRGSEMKGQQKSQKLSNEEALMKLHSLLEECGKCEIDVGTIENILSAAKETVNLGMSGTRAEVAVRDTDTFSELAVVKEVVGTNPPLLSDPRIRDTNLNRSEKRPADTVPECLEDHAHQSANCFRDGRLTESNDCQTSAYATKLGTERATYEHGAKSYKEVEQQSPAPESDSCSLEVSSSSPEKTRKKISLDTYKSKPKSMDELPSAPRRVQCNRPLTCPFNSLLPSAFQWKVEKLHISGADSRGTQKDTCNMTSTGKPMFEGRTLLKGGVEPRNIPLSRVKMAPGECLRDPRLKTCSKISKPVRRITKRQPSGSSESGFSSLSVSSDLESRLSDVATMQVPKTEEVPKSEDLCMRTGTLVHKSHIMSRSDPASDEVSKRIESLIYSHLGPNSAAGMTDDDVGVTETSIPGLGSVESNKQARHELETCLNYSGLVINNTDTSQKMERQIMLADIPSQQYSCQKYDCENTNSSPVAREVMNSDHLCSPLCPGTPTLDEKPDLVCLGHASEDVECNVEKYLGNIRQMDQESIDEKKWQKRPTRWDRRTSKWENPSFGEFVHKESTNFGRTSGIDARCVKDLDHSLVGEHCNRRPRSIIDARQRINEIKAVKAQTNCISLASMDSVITVGEREKEVGHNRCGAKRSTCEALSDSCQKRRRRATGGLDDLHCSDKSLQEFDSVNERSSTAHSSVEKGANVPFPYRGAGRFSNYITEYPNSDDSRRDPVRSKGGQRSSLCYERRFSR